jgi:hypothetical protein
MCARGACSRCGGGGGGGGVAETLFDRCRSSLNAARERDRPNIVVVFYERVIERCSGVVKQFSSPRSGVEWGEGEYDLLFLPFPPGSK